MMDVGIVEHMERNCGFSIDQIAERLPPTDQRYKSGTIIFTMKKASKKAASNNRLGFPHPGILWISEICPTVFRLFCHWISWGSPVTGTLGCFTARGAGGAEISLAAIGGHLADTTRRMATWFI